MEIKPLVSVVIPCYNDAQYIEQSVYSALNQTYKHIEVIVVDDGSNTETKTILKKIEPNITKLITQENKGQSTARNVGIKEAKGEYILILDSDDFIEYSFCEKAVEIFVKNEDIKIVTSYSNRIIDNKVLDFYKPRGGKIEDFMFINGAMGSCMFKKEDWENVEGYDEEMRNGFEDWEFYIRLLKEGGECFVLNDTLFNYRLRENSTTTSANKIKYDLLEKIIIKHKDIYRSKFENTIKYLLENAKKNKEEEQKRINSIDYRLGNALLKPLRWLKSLIK